MWFVVVCHNNKIQLAQDDLIVCQAKKKKQDILNGIHRHLLYFHIAIKNK